MQFRKKKQLLEYLGKDGKDVRLIDRMIVKGLVRFEDGVYIYEDREKELLGENEKLKREIENLKQERDKNTTQVMNKDDKMSSDSDLIDHIRYLYIRNEMRDECIKKLVGLYYKKNEAAGWDAAVEKTYQLIGFEVDPDEGAELEYIRSII